MHIHILGICGTFMGGVALLARELGHRVTGSDRNPYPPMSTALAEAGIEVWEGYEPAHLEPAPDLVLVGNALSRGNPAVEAVLDRDLPYSSGPAWLAEAVLRGRWVVAVAGTHGKTTTSAMVAWILDQCGHAPGWLIGGVPRNLPAPARLGAGQAFVVEADEYDTAFFDKRAKFVHYRPRTLVLNNLEYDHADIYPDLEALIVQFHHLVRTVPASGRIVRPEADANLDAVLARGCWTPVQRVGGDGLAAVLERPDGGCFRVEVEGECAGRVEWSLAGSHNVANALAAIAAVGHLGVAPADACRALCRFAGVRRRLERLWQGDGIAVYDDFAHHPTAIAATLEAVRRRVGRERLVAVLEPASNTMKLGVHRERLREATAAADRVLWYRPPGLAWDLEALAESGRTQVLDDLDALVAATVAAARGGAHVVVMSNGGFGGFHRRLLAALDAARVEA
ncbi:MAG: UDP-N-acetylmuramate--L-alanyl-gamma-D-glutamyl-meso-2,6-diaminoheptandioate ligase [Porticoccaceae bacterium]|nr:MAG: UDP-N-acetylmuramate--L-alanyl-gamma-D-glutamyl-meso-2,6-diaminoheptandioate ligase [Porticoccaceae bacterium]